MANFGETLKRERELREIPLRDIANATKINLRYLEALEQNRFDKLPGGVFNKGFIRAYARFIGADGEALVQRYIEEMAERDAAIAGAHPTPERPGLHRPAQAPSRRRNAATDTDAAAGSGPAITFGEGHGATGPIAGTLRARLDALPAAATVPFRPSDEPFPQARLLLAATTVVAAFAALGTVFYLVRSAQQEPRHPAGIHSEAPATDPVAPPPAEAAPATPDGPSADPERNHDPSTDPAAPADPPAQPPPGGAHGAPPAAKPETRPLPDVPRGRDGKTAPVRVASPIAAPEQEPIRTVKPPTPPPQTTPPAPAPATATPPAAAPGPMSLVLQAVTPVTVLVGCDGADRPARTMLAGETVSLRCYSLVRISAEDAGAVRLTLDGAACPALGSSGSRVEHFTIRAEDARAICPPGGTGGHGRR